MKSAAQILSASSYQKQLNSDQWRNFSAAIRHSRKFCECCKQSGKILQVHHLFYEPDKKLWDYQHDEVMVLCENCHKELHEQLKKFRKYVFKYLSPQQFQVLNGALLVGLIEYDPLTFVHALAEFASNRRVVENHARAWGRPNGTNSKPNGVG